MEHDYAELIKALRFAFDQPCYSCVLGEKCNWGDFCFFKKSADAIEELLKENAELDNSGKLLMAAFARLKEKVPHWISVEERLPDAHKNVLCCGAKGGMFIGWVSGIATVSDGTTTAFVHGGKGRCITHWMPLPEPPKEGLNKNVE